LRAGPFCLCLRLGSVLLITYMRPRRRTILSPLEGSALIDALTFMKKPIRDSHCGMLYAIRDFFARLKGFKILITYSQWKKCFS
jgi:hypothetical protein